jgi:hypothetical protein
VSYYTGKIKVVCADMMCFPVCPRTLEPMATSTYDPWAISDPEVGPLETISFSEYINGGSMMSLHRKKPRMARAAWRICTRNPRAYAPWEWSPIDRWHRAVSGRKE